MFRHLRGLRVQLLLWTIFPLAAVLIVLSVSGILRHRQAMTALVEDRDRGLTLAEANRLGREISRRAGLLVQSVSEIGPAQASFDDLVDGLRQDFPGGLALLNKTGEVAYGLPGATWWMDSEEARILTSRTFALATSQFEGLLTQDSAPSLLMSAIAPGDQVLIGAVPVETLGLADSSQLVETEIQGATLIFDATGRRMHIYNPLNLPIDSAALADLRAADATEATTTHLRAGDVELLVTYARVEPPGWILVTTEDIHAITSMGMSVVEVLPLALLFVAVFALLALSFGVANVVRPLQELDRRAARVAWGDFDVVNEPVGGIQEMDDLRATLAQMAERIRSYQAGMRDYLSAVTQAQEEERHRLARELHDDNVQALIALKQRVEMARKSLRSDPARAGQRLDELKSLIEQELTSVRRLISDLRPIYLEDLGFVPALEMLARETHKRHGIEVSLAVRGEARRLAPDLELAAYRIVQQALANVVAHAQAEQVWIEVLFAADGLTLRVKDDGQGFRPPDQPSDLAAAGHFGLMGMRERALLYGGRLQIASAAGQGATITAWLPLA